MTTATDLEVREVLVPVRLLIRREASASRFVHRGSCAALPETYAQIERWMRARGGITTTADWNRYAPSWEEYVTDPRTTPEADLVTYIYLSLH